jgi:hypothetical protein
MDVKYQGIMLHGLAVYSEASIESDKNDLVKDGVKYLCERFLNSEYRIEMYTKVYDTFTWPTGMELQNFGVEKVKLLVQQFQVQLASSSMNFENIKYTILNEWYEFNVLGKGMKFNKLSNKVLTNGDRFPLLGKLISGLVGLNTELLSFSSGS